MGYIQGICCSKSDSTVPKSDLFVPEISVDEMNAINAKSPEKKSGQKKLVTSLKAMTSNKENNYPKMTTEHFIQKNTKIKNSFTLDAEHSKQLKITLTIKNYTSIEESKLKEETIKKKNTQNIILKSTLTDYSKFQNALNKSEKKKEPTTEQLQCEITEHLVSLKEQKTISNIFLYHYLFHKTTQENLAFIMKELKEFRIDDKSPIFREGDEGSCIFIIKSGIVILSSKNSKNKFIIRQGKIFGELALVKDNIKRTYDATAASNLTFYSLEKTVFQEIKSNFINKNSFKFELFNFIDEELKDSLQLLTTSLEFKKNKVITDLKGLFWIRKGSIRLCDSSGKVKDIYGTDEFIGISKFSNDVDDQNYLDNSTKMYEIDKVTNNKYSMKLIAEEDVLCTVIPDFAFVEVFGVDFKYKLYKYFLKETICQNKYMKKLINDYTLNDIVKLFSLQEYKQNDMLSSELPEDIPQKIIIIVEGQACMYTNNGKNQTLLASCQIIGEELFLGLESKNIIVESNHLITLECSWDIFKEKVNLMGNSLEKTINNLSFIYFFQELPIYKLIEISENLSVEKYKEGDVIIKKGEKVENIYFIHEGTVKFLEDNETFKDYHKGNSFGEIFLLNGKPAQGEIVNISKNCILYKMTKNYFFELLSDPKLNQRTKKKLCLEDMEIFPSNLYYITTLYRGATSNVYLVHNKIYVYVLKAIYIQNYYQASAFEGKSTPNVLNEKSASKRLDNPFFIRYVKTLKNSCWCFFVEEYINGIVLSEYIRMCKPFHSIEFCRFHSACFLIMLETLKNLGFIHRDIRQENIIIEKNGYPRLIDFSCCKRIIDDKTKTMIGTPYFMAPEILKGKEYSYSCDYWSIGILIYYLYYGEYPFGNNTNQPDTIYKEIINKNLEFLQQKDYNEVSLQEIIKNLLNKNEEERFCSLEKFKDLNFFKNFDFDKLRRRSIKAPLIPEVVKFNYKGELENLKNPFNNFIQSERLGNVKNTSTDLVHVYEEDDFNLHKNIMKWYEQF